MSSELAQKSLQVRRTTLIVEILVTLILLGALLSTWLHIRNLRRANQRDEKRISELKEANEKVRMADAAKTRFV